VTAEALECLSAYHWPGNVRELRNMAERLVLRSRSGRIAVDGLPADVLPNRRQLSVVPPPGLAASSTVPEMLFERMVKDGECFWSVVYEPFLSRDLTRSDLREVVRLGLEQTRGNYKLLTTAFKMPPDDYKRFMGFLRKHQCHLPFRRFRVVRSEIEAGVGQAMSV
jgi:transcriptional regulator of acetoin/glycerol metabolism